MPARARKSPRTGVPAGPNPRRHHRWVWSAADHAGPCRRRNRRSALRKPLYVPSGPAGPIGSRSVGRCRCLAIGNVSRGCDRFNPFVPAPPVRAGLPRAHGRRHRCCHRSWRLAGLGALTGTFNGGRRLQIREPELRNIHPLIGGVPAPDCCPTHFSFPCPFFPPFTPHGYPFTFLINSRNSISSHLTRTPRSSTSGASLSLVNIWPVSGSIPSVLGRYKSCGSGYSEANGRAASVSA